MDHLGPAPAAEEQHRQEHQQRSRPALVTVGANRSRAARRTSVGPNASPSPVLEVLAAPDEQRRCGAPPARTRRGTRRSCRSRSGRRRSARRSTPPASAPGSATNSTDASRQLPNAACRSRKIPTAAATRHADEGQPRRLPVLVVTEQLGVVLEREARCLADASLDVARHRVDVAPAHVDADVDAPRDALVPDDVRARRRAARRRPRRGAPARRRRAGRSAAGATSSRLLRVSGVPQTTTSKIFWSSKRLPDLDAGEHRGRGPADVAGLDAERLRLVEVDLDLAGSAPSTGSSTRGASTPSTLGDRLAHLVGLGREVVEVVAEDADGEVLALDAVGVVEDVVDALLRIGRAPSVDARVAGRRPPRSRPPSRRSRPTASRLTQSSLEFDADRLVAEDRPGPTWPPTLSTPGSARSSWPGAGRDPAHLGERRCPARPPAGSAGRGP